MFAATTSVARTHDARLAAARSKALLSDARGFERRAATKAFRRAGRVSVAEALDECDDAQDDADELRNAVEIAECDEFSEADMAALIALADSTPVVF